MNAPLLESDERRLSYYVEVVGRRWLVVLIAMAVVTTATIIMSLLQTRQFEGTSAVLLDRQDVVGVITGIPTQIQDPDRLASTQANLARTPELARRVLTQASLQGMDVEELLRESSVTPKTNSDILEFRVQAGTRDAAKLLANTYATEFTKYKEEINLASLNQASLRLKARLARLRAAGQQRTTAYAQLVADQRQLETVKALVGSGDVVVRNADPAHQVQPQLLRNVILGLVLGMVLGLSLAFLYDALDTRVRSEAELTRALNLPLLARVPRSSGRSDISLRPEDDTDAMIEGEAFRMLRANLQLATLDLDARIVLVTSAVPGEGKSTVVANLGVALARAGREVILADIDLRKPTLHRIFGLGRRGGLTDIARRSSDVDRALVEVAIDRSGHATLPRRTRTGPTTARRKKADESSTLRVLPAGPPPPDPGEFVETELVSQVLMDLRAQSDIVLVDAPPLLTVGDATSLSMQADTLLLVVRPELLRRAQLEDLGRTLESIPTPTVGFVTVGADSNVPEYYYGMSVGEPEPRWRSLLAWGRQRLSRPRGPLGYGPASAGAPAPPERSKGSGLAGSPERTGGTESPPVISVPKLPIRDAAAHRPTRGGPVAHDDAAAPER